MRTLVDVQARSLSRLAGWTSPDPNDPSQLLSVNAGAGCSSKGGPGCVTMQPGLGSAKAILAAVTDRINDSNALGRGDSWQNSNPADSRVVELPLVDYAGVHGSSTEAPVMGLAKVWLVGSDSYNSCAAAEATHGFLRNVPFIVTAASPGRLTSDAVTA
ncbi:MAG TPA: hypothetical protein VMV15_01645 [Candidatus Binataceae bacterium]|nr:hypothetical protein [Candidatus Binataceae bacterium]